MPTETIQRSAQSLNEQLAQKSALVMLVERQDIGNLLKQFDYDWITGQCNSNSELFSIFKAQGWIHDDSGLTRLGRLVYGRMALHFELLDDSEKTWVGNYEIKELIRRGKNSVIF